MLKKDASARLLREGRTFNLHPSKMEHSPQTKKNVAAVYRDVVERNRPPGWLWTFWNGDQQTLQYMLQAMKKDGRVDEDIVLVLGLFHESKHNFGKAMELLLPLLDESGLAALGLKDYAWPKMIMASDYHLTFEQLLMVNDALANEIGNAVANLDALEPCVMCAVAKDTLDEVSESLLEECRSKIVRLRSQWIQNFKDNQPRSLFGVECCVSGTLFVRKAL